MLTPSERRALVEKPFPVIRRFTTSYPHAGTLIEHDPDNNSLKKRLSDGESLTVLEPDFITEIL